MPDTPPLTVVPSPKEVVSLGKADGCVQCGATDRAFAKLGILVTKRDGTTEKNRALAHSLGHMQAPVVLVIRDGEIVDHWSGYNPFKIGELKADPQVERVPVHGLVA